MGLNFDALTEDEAAARLVESAARGEGRWMLTANLDHLRRHWRGGTDRELIDRADSVVADGVPLVWASWIAGRPLPERVAGSSLVWRICELAARHSVPVFLVGGNPGVARRAAGVLCESYPRLDVVGTNCPPFGFEHSPAEVERIVDAVTGSRARLVLVALSFPKQEALIETLRRHDATAAHIGIGIGLSFVAGEVSRAPQWVRSAGLEWAHRLAQEPRRLARRYLIDGLPFAARLLGWSVMVRVRLSRR